MKINIIGDIAGSSGYAIHTRELAKALSKIADVKLNCNIPPGFEKELTDRELENIKKQDSQDRVNLIITNPSVWKLHLNKKINIVYLIFEGSHIPDWIINNCLDKRISKILVASTHTRDAVVRTLHERYSIQNPFSEGTQIPRSSSVLNNIIIPKLRVINHGVCLDTFYKKDMPKNKFTFLCLKGWRNNEDRGGNQYAVKSFLEEFNSKDNVRMIIKINPAYGIPDVNKLTNELNIQNKDLPELIFDGASYPYNQLVNIYNQADVFVMPTRAEAYGIPVNEASACGIPTICTNFGGQIDFVDNEIGWLVDYDLTEVKHEILYEGISWATPKIDDLRSKMRYAYENKEEVKIKGEKAREKVKGWTWDITAKRIIDVLD